MSKYSDKTKISPPCAVMTCPNDATTLKNLSLGNGNHQLQWLCEECRKELDGD